MVIFPPFLPSALWYAEWMDAISHGASFTEACAKASILSGCKGKDVARCLLPGHGEETSLMGVPLEGGAGQLKNHSCKVAAIQLSNHGNWRHNHLSTLEALYGRTPFFQHLMPLLRERYVFNAERAASLSGFNLRLHEAITGFIGDVPELSQILSSETLHERGEEVAAGINPRLSIIDPLMRYGREAVLALPLLSEKR